MKLRSEAFQRNDPIPHLYAREGEDCSPPLSWSDLPEDAETLALLVEDPDAPSGSFTHWMIWNIPVSMSGLHEGVCHSGRLSDDIRQGENDFGEAGWSGPAPPRGESHRYVFHLYALDGPLELAEGARRRQFERAVGRHALGEATLVGRYGGAVRARPRP